MQPKTKIDFFPLHDNDGEGSRDLVWLQKEWARPLRTNRLLAVLRLWQACIQKKNFQKKLLRISGRTCMCTHTHTHRHTHTHARTHAHIHTYIHLYADCSEFLAEPAQRPRRAHSRGVS